MPTPNDQIHGETPREIEARLVRHYLHSEGAGGAGSLRFLDASEAELQVALGTNDTADALPALLTACGEAETVGVLAHGWNGVWPDRDAPGYFRFLVLTCAVVASADENPETHDFGQNLQRLFDTRRVFSQRAGLPRMWNALVAWSKRQRASGAPIRSVELPPRGNGIHIGLTNSISFPNWRDVLHLRGEFERSRVLAARLRTPSDVARVLCPRVGIHAGYSAQMVAASDEFHRLYMSSASLLHLHRFWAVVCRALERARPRSSPGMTVRVELQLGVRVEDTSLRFSALGRDGIEREDGPASLEDTLEQAIERFRSWGGEQPSVQRWRNLFTGGAVPFMQERFGVWSAADVQSTGEGSWLFLVASPRMTKIRHLAVARGQELTPYWTMVGPLEGKDAALLHRALGLDAMLRTDALPNPVTFLGGVRTRRGWLGRSTVLPWLHREGRGELSVQPAVADEPSVKIVDVGTGRFAITTETPLNGTYRIRLEETAQGVDSLAVEKSVRFIADAPEHPNLCTLSNRWQLEPECRDEAWIQGDSTCNLETESKPRQSNDALHERFDDLLEVIYALGRSHWSESELAGAIRELMPGPSPWDVMRSLREAGWLAHATSVTWKASSWWLVEPHLVPFTLDGEPAAMLAGSAPTIVRRRLKETTEAHGGMVTSHLGVSTISPLTVVASRINVARLAGELGWQVQPPRTGGKAAAPGCWPVSRSDAGQHQLFKEWDWRAGRFLELPKRDSSAKAALTWWRRKVGDREDLYAVEGRSGSRFTTSSRTVALAEAYRASALPMFQISDDRLVRIPGEGNLPLHLATSLHLSTLRSSGPIRSAEGWTYAYALSREGLKLVQACLGRRFIVGTGTRDSKEELVPAPSTAFGFSRHRAAASMNLIRSST